MRYLFGAYTLDTLARALRCVDTVVPLEPKAYHVLLHLVEQRQRQVTRTELLEQVWADSYVDDSVVSRCIVALRRALGDSPETQQVIQTRRGYGYRFVAPVVCQEAPMSDTMLPPVVSAPLAEALQAAAADVITPPVPVVAPPHTWLDSEAERKVVTALCCRISATAAATAELDLDEQHSLLQDLFAVLTPEAERYGGTLQPLLGEGFMALFGAPTAYEDHALRAVLAGLGIRERWQGQRTEAGGSVGEMLTLHLGVHTGPIVVNLAAGASLLPYAAGDTATLALRLAQGSAPGSLVLSDTTAQLVVPMVRVEALRPEQYPVGTSPRPVYHVLGMALPHTPMAGRGDRVLTPFVGREAELATLHALLAQVEQGRGQIIGVVGEPGIGKSRLLYEFRRSLAARPLTYHTGRCVSYGRATPYAPIIDLLRLHCAITDTDAPEAMRDKLHRGLQAVDMAPDSWGTALCQLLGVPAGDTPPLSPDLFTRHVHAALQQMSLHSSQQQPLVCEIEDLHWIDPSSEAYLAALARRVTGAALFLVCTYRPGYRPPWMETASATQIALQPLAPQASQQTVRALLRRRPEATTMAPLIVAKAHGNPFFFGGVSSGRSGAGGQSVALGCAGDHPSCAGGAYGPPPSPGEARVADRSHRGGGHPGHTPPGGHAFA